MRIDKPAVLRFVNICRKLFLTFSCVAIPTTMVLLVFAFLGYVAFWFIAPAVFVVYLVVYGFYALCISMGTAIGFEIAGKVLYVRTRRKTYTYDAGMGCTKIKVSKRKFVCTFETQDSSDKFTFPRRVLFAKSYEEQFTPDEIALFFPQLKEYFPDQTA